MPGRFGAVRRAGTRSAAQIPDTQFSTLAPTGYTSAIVASIFG
ncbi:hypothetical protein [Microbacterium sp. HJ5]